MWSNWLKLLLLFFSVFCFLAGHGYWRSRICWVGQSNWGTWAEIICSSTAQGLPYYAVLALVCFFWICEGVKEPNYCYKMSCNASVFKWFYLSITFIWFLRSPRMRIRSEVSRGKRRWIMKFNSLRQKCVIPRYFSLQMFLYLSLMHVWNIDWKTHLQSMKSQYFTACMIHLFAHLGGL